MTGLYMLWVVTIDLLADAGVIGKPGAAHGWFALIALVLCLLHDLAGYARSR